MRNAIARTRCCPVNGTVECPQFPPIPTNPRLVGMSPEQIAVAGISPSQQLYWCSECGSIWCESMHNHARRIGKQTVLGSTFIASDIRDDSFYIGAS